MALPVVKVPKLSEHGGELFLLGIVAVGVLGLIGLSIGSNIRAGASVGRATIDVSPFLLVIQSIVSAIKDRWNARLQGQSNQLLGAAPAVNDNGAATGKKGDPVHTTEEEAA